jgi:hypothetical protein
VHSETVQQIAAPSADHQSSRKQYEAWTPTTRENGYGDTQQPDGQEIQQRT